MQHLQLTTLEVDGHAVVRLKGELDIATVDDLRHDLRKARQSYGDHVILDLAELEFMDSQGLSVIVGCHKAVTATGGSLALVAPRPIVRRTLEITGLSGRLRIFGSVEEAAAPRETAAS
ncbi:MAG TPA: STAS domain-containing protein [Streptosporangiaceae bacterium]|nr:STAS domain-containing protein [Streptosporangiaceae bacterium]